MVKYVISIIFQQSNGLNNFNNNNNIPDNNKI